MDSPKPVAVLGRYLFFSMDIVIVRGRVTRCHRFTEPPIFRNYADPAPRHMTISEPGDPLFGHGALEKREQGWNCKLGPTLKA